MLAFRVEKLPTVHHKGSIVHFLVKVATVSHVFFAGLLIFGEKAVVSPLPGKATLKRRVLVECIDVFFDVTRAIPHSVDLR